MVDSKVGFQHGATARVSALGERKNEGLGRKKGRRGDFECL
jgi:hypothetical protein